MVVENIMNSKESYKVRQAQKSGVPVVGLQYLIDSIEKGVLLDSNGYLVVQSNVNIKQDDQLTQGVIKGQKSTFNYFYDLSICCFIYLICYIWGLQ